MTDNHPPYPNPLEVIRTAANALGIKHYAGKEVAKQLDDRARELDPDYRHIDYFLIKSIKEPLLKYYSENIAIETHDWLKALLTNYRNLAGKITLEGAHRNQSIELLVQHFFLPHCYALLCYLSRTHSGPAVTALLNDNSSSVGTVLAWLSVHQKQWITFHRSLTKEYKDRLSAWSRGTDFPSAGTVKLLQDEDADSIIDEATWMNIRALLLIGRTVDWARKNDLFAQIRSAAMHDSNSQRNTAMFVHKSRQINEKEMARLGSALPLIADIQNGLKRTEKKPAQAKARLLTALHKARQIVASLNADSSCGHWIDWHEARWHALSGDLSAACDMYQKAFDGCIYRAGPIQKEIIEEAIVIAASRKPYPDKTFLARLKNALIVFNYDLPSVSGKMPIRSKKAEALIQDWEIDLWRSNFGRIFPKEGFFEGTNVSFEPCRSGPIILTETPSFRTSSDQKNRKRKIGDAWAKPYPQLAWAVSEGDVDAVTKLLKAGADVTAVSDSNETALLMALVPLDVTTPFPSSSDDTMFKIIASHSDTVKTINTRSEKRKLTPLISGVRTGRPEIVKRLLEMGADPEIRGQTDNQTALQTCVNLIGLVKKPKNLSFSNALLAPQVLDSFRRHTNGLYGFTLEHQVIALEELTNDPSFQAVASAVSQITQSKIQDKLPVQVLRKIPTLLLEHGADPNAEHTTPEIFGYTPLMLAAELDEGELFGRMIEHGGDMFKSYRDPRTNSAIDCIHIANHFNSTTVQRIICETTGNLPQTQ